MDFEKRLNRLEEIVEKMETGELSLEDSLKLFEEGVKLSRECNTQLSEAEQKVKLLLGIDDDGNAVTSDFVAQEG
jgi:exodeoxyribonuclease VII small subunit